MAGVALAPVPYVLATFLISSRFPSLVLIAPSLPSSRGATRGRGARRG
jgi:hypothetical protein